MTINGTNFLDPKKEKETSKIYWLTSSEGMVGEHLFSFDLKKVYNLFSDYPHNLSKEEKEIFDEEYPFWVDFFKETK